MLSVFPFFRSVSFVGLFFFVSPSSLFQVAARRNYLERGIAAGERNSGGWPCCCLSVAVTVEETKREEDLLKWGELRWFLWRPNESAPVKGRGRSWLRGCGFVWPAEKGEGRWWSGCLRVKWETRAAESVWERWGKRRGSVEEEERMSGCLLLARRGGREVVSSGSLAFGQKRGDWLEAWEEKKYISKGRGRRIVGLFLAKDGGSHYSLF